MAKVPPARRGVTRIELKLEKQNGKTKFISIKDQTDTAG